MIKKGLLLEGAKIDENPEDSGCPVCARVWRQADKL
jgi:hypothetical protein